MQTTRQRILQTLETNRQATALELSQVLDLTPANIRHHLGILQKDGQVEVIGQNPPAGRGRPTFLYMPTRRAQPNALDTLAAALLDQLQSRRSKNQQRARLKSLAERLGGPPDESPTHSITLRLAAAIPRLNALHYQARWEAHPDAPHLFLGRCPYAQIIADHPELCQMDSFLLHHLLGVEVQHAEKIDRHPGGPQHCRFILKG